VLSDVLGYELWKWAQQSAAAAAVVVVDGPKRGDWVKVVI